MEIDLGVRRIPVRTRFITWRVGLAETIEEAVVGLRRPGDVIALSESAAAAGQGRVLPPRAGAARDAGQVPVPHVGKAGPLHSPAGMQGAIMVCGRGRVVAGAVAGAFGKVVGRQGWFYRVAGPQAAMIDDVAACLPPHDHHLIFGPRDPDGLARRLATALHGKVAIVDANHSSGAWVVGAFYGVDREWLCRALADNPAGNEDEQTPSSWSADSWPDSRHDLISVTTCEPSRPALIPRTIGRGSHFLLTTSPDRLRSVRSGPAEGDGAPISGGAIRPPWAPSAEEVRAWDRGRWLERAPDNRGGRSCCGCWRSPSPG